MQNNTKQEAVCWYLSRCSGYILQLGDKSSSAAGQEGEDAPRYSSRESTYS